MTEAKLSPETKGRNANHETENNKALVFLEQCVSGCLYYLINKTQDNV